MVLRWGSRFRYKMMCWTLVGDMGLLGTSVGICPVKERLLRLELAQRQR